MNKQYLLVGILCGMVIMFFFQEVLKYFLKQISDAGKIQALAPFSLFAHSEAPCNSSVRTIKFLDVRNESAIDLLSVIRRIEQEWMGLHGTNLDVACPSLTISSSNGTTTLQVYFPYQSNGIPHARIVDLDSKGKILNDTQARITHH